LADKGYSEDSTFWHDFMFKFIYVKQKPKGAPRSFEPFEAKKVWESLIYLKLKCPDVELLNTLKHLEQFMPVAKQ
jgi:hypothetical protein